MIVKSDAKAVQRIAKPVTGRPAEGLPRRPMGVAQETGELPGGDGVSASGELESEGQSVTTEIVETDVTAPDELDSEGKSATTGIVETDVKAPDGLESEDKSATTVIVKTDVKAVQPMAKPVTARPAEGLPEHPMNLAQEIAVFLRRASWSPRTSRKPPGS